MTHELVAEAHRRPRGRTIRFSPENLIRSFWAKVVVTPSGCWEWTGTVDRKGYGRVCRDYKMWLVHRYVWHTVVGPIPDGMMLLHRCDNPPCCNPEHLYLGNGKDNVRDLKERHPERLSGRARPHRLEVDDVQAIRREYGITPTDLLARRYRISDRHVLAIARRERGAWAWLDA